MTQQLLDSAGNMIGIAIAIFTGNDMSLPDVVLIGSIILVLYIVIRVLYVTIRLLWFGAINKINALRTHPAVFTSHPGKKSILILGDSTAFGTGARRIEDSIAGRLARDFHDTEIINYAVNGSLTKDVVAQLERAQGKKYDMIILSTGGNDIWHFTSLRKVERYLQVVLVKALSMSDHRVIILLYANFGLSPLFPRFLRKILEKRSNQVRLVFEKVSDQLKVPCIDLFSKNADDLFNSNPFKERPDIYFARDYMHPSSEGYALWYKHMWSKMVGRGYYFGEEGQPAKTRGFYK